MKKFLSVLLAALMLMSLAMSANADEIVRVALVTDTGGIGDQSFNDLAWAGLQRAKEELGIDVSFLESVTESDYAANPHHLQRLDDGRRARRSGRSSSRSDVRHHR